MQQRDGNREAQVVSLPHTAQVHRTIIILYVIESTNIIIERFWRHNVHAYVQLILADEQLLILLTNTQL